MRYNIRMKQLKEVLPIVIAKTLKQAVALGPEHTADLLRQKLTALLHHLENGMEPVEAIKKFQIAVGMNEIAITPEGLGDK